MICFFSSFSRATGDAEEPDRIFVGGLPYLFTEVQIKDLLESFGYKNLIRWLLSLSFRILCLEL